MMMDVYDYESYRMSISNLLMLKLFHDEGVDIQQFQKFIVHTQYNEETCFDIFYHGMSNLFQSFKHISYEELDGFKETYHELFEDDGYPENIYCFQGSLLENVLKGPYEKEFRDSIKSVTFGDNEGDVYVLPDNSGFAYFAEFSSIFHELAEPFLNLNKQARELMMKHERELKEDGLSNKLLDRKSA